MHDLSSQRKSCYAYQRGIKLKNYSACRSPETKKSEIVATYESFTRIATVTRLRLDLWSGETQTRVSSPSALQVVTLQQATTQQLVSVSGSGSGAAFGAG